MESVFTVLLLVLVLLFYFSNKNNRVNRWCAVAGFIFWLGIVKESFMYNLVPWLDAAWGYTVPYACYKGAYSAMTWALYSLAMPTAVIFSLLFSNMDGRHPKLMRWLKVFIYLPGLLLSFFFSPLEFHEYQLSSLPFWITYSVYNLCLLIAYAFFIIAGVRGEKPGKAKTQKKSVGMIALPPILYWYITVFPTHTLEMRSLLKLWQGNVFILFICIVLYIFMAFREGFMGLRLTGETYQWNSDMGIISKGAEYTSHMLKNQTTKMEWCIENLKTQYDRTGKNPPEELAILSRSITTLKSYTDKMKKHSEAVHLFEEPCNIKVPIESALSSSPEAFQNGIPVRLSVEDNAFLLYDKTHMEETFANIILNAVEATHDAGAIEITGGYDKKGRYYLLKFTDHGVGMSREDVKNMFTPYFTTKNTEKSFGLELSYCKNVVEKHGGRIRAESEPGRGTTVTVELPARRIALGGTDHETEG